MGTDTPSSPAPAGLGALLRLAGRQLPLTLGACLLSMLAAVMQLAPYGVLHLMALEVFSPQPRQDALQRLALVALAALVLRYLLASAASMLAHTAAFRLMHDLQLRLARKLAGVPMSFFSRHGGGSLQKAFVTDAPALEGFVAHHLPDIAAALTVPLAAALALFAMDWRLALASVAMLPVALAMQAIFFGRDARERMQSWHDMQARTNTAMLEYLRSIHVIKTYGLGARSFGELRESIRASVRWLADYTHRMRAVWVGFTALLGASLLVIAPVGVWLLQRGEVDLPTLLLFIVLGPQVLAAFLRLTYAGGDVMRIGEGLRRLDAMLREPELAQPSERAGTSAPAQPPVPKDHGLSLHDVHLRYDGRAALRGVSFEARAGCVTALVGPSGAGKTSVARLVARLWDPDAGEVRLGGVDLRDWPLDRLLDQVALVFQDVFLFSGSVRDNLRLAAPGASDDEIEAAARLACAHDFIVALPQGYDTLLGERGARLSGGERQRLSIARALLKRGAPVLVLDEATAFTDPDNEARIQAGLAQACRGRTVLVVAHRLASIADADHIVVLDQGRVVDQGRHPDLLARCPLYARLWADQQSAADWQLNAARPQSAASTSTSLPDEHHEPA